MLNRLKITAKNSVIYSLGNLSTKLAGLFLLPLYTSKFSVEQYGVIGLLEVSMQIMVTLFGLNLFNAFFRWYWDENYLNKQKQIFYTVFITVIAVCAIIALPLVTFASGFSRLIFTDISFAYIFQLSVISAGLETMGVLPATLMRLQGKALNYSISYLVKLLINVGLNIYLIIYLRKGIESIYYAAIAGNLIYLIYVGRYTLRNLIPRFEFKILKSMLSFSLPLLLSTITGVILTVTDRYVLGKMTGLNDVGTYSLGFKLANTIRFLIIIPINLAVLPIFYKIIDTPGSKRFYARFTTYYSFVTILAVLVMVLFADIIVKVFAQNKDYWDAWKVVPIIAFSVLFGMLKDMSLTGLNIIRNTKAIAIIMISLTILNLILNVILIPKYKSIGASLSTLVTQMLFSVIIYFTAQRAYFIPYELGRFFKMLIVSIGISVLSLVMPDMNMYMRIIFNLLLLAAFPLLLFPLNFYEQNEIKGLKGFYRKWKNLGNLKQNLNDLLKLPTDV
jgi:O-antigen/teichoic acid export membrane protein